MVEAAHTYSESSPLLLMLSVDLIFRQCLTEIKKWLFIGQETNIVKIIVRIEMKPGNVKNTGSNFAPQ